MSLTDTASLTFPLLGGIEAGGTKMVVSVGTGPADPGERLVVPTTTPDQTWPAVIETLEQAAAGRRLAAIGVATFGPVDLDRSSASYGQVTTTPKPGWSGFDMVSPLAAHFGVPVGFDTDVNGAALAESRWGAGRGVGSLVYLTVGTGVGGGAVIDGHPVHGLLHPEMGHLPVIRHPQDDHRGSCPYHGACVEGMAAGPSFADRFGHRLEEASDEELALAVEFAGTYLGQLVASIVLILSAERVVIGGGVPNVPGVLAKTREVATAMLNGYVAVPAITNGMKQYVAPPLLGDRAGVLGAMALADDALSSARVAH